MLNFRPTTEKRDNTFICISWLVERRYEGGCVGIAIGKPFLRQPQPIGDTRATPEDKRRAIARRAAEVKDHKAIFAANANTDADTTNTP
jgi:hypothetical protein